MDDEAIVTAARAVLLELPELLGPAAAAVEARLEDLLNPDAGRPDTDSIVELLSARTETRQAMHAALTLIQIPDTRSPDLELPGFGEPSQPVIYRCPACGFGYPVYEVGEPVPQSCPNGHSPLVKEV